MTEELQAPTIALCPYCGSSNRHHWPDGCIGLLNAEIAILKEELTAANRKPCAGCISFAAGGGAR
jgi:hypothetical protein